jgi:hypothetical protein
VNAFEDQIRRVMASHDDEAPRAEDLLRSLERATPPRRRLADWYVPLAFAAAVVAVVAGSLWGVRLLGSQAVPAASLRPTVQAAALSCPARYARQAPWVPARPTGVDGRARLVPQQTPSSALICAYAGSNMAKQQAGWALSGRRSLTGNLAGLAAQLTWQPRLLPGHRPACTLVGGPQTNYLIGLRYPGGGMMWVTATAEPNECVAASNGEFTSTGTIGPAVSKAFASGRWPARQAVSCNKSFQDIGRLGEDKALVPAGATSLTICTSKAHTFSSGYQALVRALNQLPTKPSTGRCSPSPASSTPTWYELYFSYPQGPPASVEIAVGCYPEVGSRYFQSYSASTVLPIIQQLLKAK